MFKQSPSRNNRSKGFKAKHVLQICVLLVICFWLIYQVQRSHNKKEGFDTEDEKGVGKVQSDDEILRLGRKDLPRTTETDTDEHVLDEEEENKNEDDEQEMEDTMGDDREDEIDENDLEKAEAETEHEDEINKSEKEVEKAEPAHVNGRVDEENERDDNEEIDAVEDEDRSEIEAHEEAKDDHGEAEEDEGGSKADHDDGDVKLEEQVHEGESRNTHEAREEQYKADDASSEVAHGDQTIMPETGNSTIEHTNETVTFNVEDVGLRSGQDEANTYGTSINVSVTEFKELKAKSEVMDDENHLQPLAGSNSTENVTTGSLLSDDPSSSLRDMNDTNTMSAEGGESEDNETVDSDEGANVIPHDPISASESTLTQDEKDSRMDLDTLPEITTEVQNSDDAVAE